MHILLVDDDTELTSLLSEFLRREGFTVEAEHEGNSGLSHASRQGVDLVVLDVMLPGLDGFEVLKEIRSTEPSKTMPVIIHTSKNLSALELNLIADMGVTHYPKQAFATEESIGALLNALRMAGIER